MLSYKKTTSAVQTSILKIKPFNESGVIWSIKHNNTLPRYFYSISESTSSGKKANLPSTMTRWQQRAISMHNNPLCSWYGRTKRKNFIAGTASCICCKIHLGINSCWDDASAFFFLFTPGDLSNRAYCCQPGNELTQSLLWI